MAEEGKPLPTVLFMAGPALKINVTANIGPLMNIKRFAEKNRPVMLNLLGERFAKFLKRHYIAYSAGSKTWEPLSDRTKDNKEYRNIAPDPSWILRETSGMLNAITHKVEGDKVYVGFVRNVTVGRKGARRRVYWLAMVHQKGVPANNLPSRIIIVPPDNSQRKQYVEEVRKAYNREIRRGRR